MGDARSSPRPRVRWVLLLAALIVALAGGLAYLRARYDWGDLLAAAALLARHLSRPLVGLAFLCSAPLVWLGLRWRSPQAAWIGSAAYLGGVAADVALLLALAPLGISYGPVLLPAALLAALRCAMAVELGAIASLFKSGARSPVWPLLHVGAQALLLAVAVDGFAVEPSRLDVSRLAVPDPYTSAGRPLRIVQISDWHIERANGLAWQVVETVNSLAPDVIALTGDYLNGSFTDDPQAVADLRDLIMALHARYGIYAVYGNQDPARGPGELLRGLPVTVLDDRWRSVEADGRQVVIAGLTVDDRWRSLADSKEALSQVAGAMPRGCFSVLLDHSPDLAPEAAEAGFDLNLTGHTHGGQIRLPLYGALTTSSIYGKRYEAGAYHVGGMLVYVSRGIGMKGWPMPRMRFLCPPEVACFDIG